MDLLIPYIKMPKGHEDPCFREFTYGDAGIRGRKLINLRKGDYIFFHTGFGKKRLITYYYIVDRVLPTTEIAKDEISYGHYKNPHISEYRLGQRHADDVVVFGDPITSRVLPKPLTFDSTLARKLSLNIKLSKNKTERQSLSSATRAFRVLTANDVKVLLKAIRINEATTEPPKFLSTEEVTEIIEKDVENFIANNPKNLKKALIIRKPLNLTERQIRTEAGLPDLVFENDEQIIIVEIKVSKAGREALAQLKRYASERTRRSKKAVIPVLVCSGIMPAFEEEFKKEKRVKFLFYGWGFDLKVWPT